jgi:hypothetical protein
MQDRLARYSAAVDANIEALNGRIVCYDLTLQLLKQEVTGIQFRSAA